MVEAYISENREYDKQNKKQYIPVKSYNEPQYTQGVYFPHINYEEQLADGTCKILKSGWPYSYASCDDESEIGYKCDDITIRKTKHQKMALESADTPEALGDKSKPTGIIISNLQTSIKKSWLIEKITSGCHCVMNARTRMAHDYMNQNESVFLPLQIVLKYRVPNVVITWAQNGYPELLKLYESLVSRVNRVKNEEEICGALAISKEATPELRNCVIDQFKCRTSQPARILENYMNKVSSLEESIRLLVDWYFSLYNNGVCTDRRRGSRKKRTSVKQANDMSTKKLL